MVPALGVVDGTPGWVVRRIIPGKRKMSRASGCNCSGFFPAGTGTNRKIFSRVPAVVKDFRAANSGRAVFFLPYLVRAKKFQDLSGPGAKPPGHRPGILRISLSKSASRETLDQPGEFWYNGASIGAGCTSFPPGCPEKRE